MGPLKQLTIVFPLAAVAIVLAACSADRQDPADNGLLAHPDTWMEEESADFHGALVAENTPQSCTSCHGEQFEGDGRAPDCYQCHNGPGGHPEGWVSPLEPFHGQAVEEAQDITHCSTCHGVDYRGGWAAVSCYECHNGPSGHPVGWLTPSSPAFHGHEVADDGDAQCAACHGADFLGGWSGVSCTTCHDYPPDGAGR